MTLLLTLALAAQPAVLAPPKAADGPMAVPVLAPSPATRAEEEAAIGRTIAEVYAVISGPAGKPRDWARMRTLFTPEARLYAIGRQRLNGGSLDDYIANAGPTLVRVGFTEKELARRVELYGNLAQVWSSYHGTSTDGSVNVRGINSFQLARQPDGRWLVHSILWQQERPKLSLPADMDRR